jgi:hypothetical protein
MLDVFGGQELSVSKRQAAVRAVAFIESSHVAQCSFCGTSALRH